MSKSEEKFLQQLEGGAGRFVVRRLFLWVIRTSISCGLTWLLVHYYPNLSWVWYLTVGVAAFSFVFTVVIGVVLIRKGDQIRELLARADDDSEFDGGDDSDDDWNERWQDSEDAEVIDDGWTEPADEEHRR